MGFPSIFFYQASYPSGKVIATAKASLIRNGESQTSLSTLRVQPGGGDEDYFGGVPSFN
jgi:hypothetical protein